MTTEAQLVDALAHRATPSVASPLASFESVRSRSAAIGRRRRRRRAVIGATAATLVVAMIAFGVRLASADRTRVATVTPDTTGAANGIDLLIAAPDAGQLAIWRDGARQRLIATGLGNVTAVATSPDGRTAVIVTDDPSAGCSSAAGPALSRIDLDSGSSERLVGWATDAMISPDGAWVAYEYRCDGVGVGITSLRDGTNFRVGAAEGSRPLAFTGSATLLYAEPTSDGTGAKGFSTSESSFTDGGWQPGVRVDRHASPPVADPWVADASDSVFGVGSRLDAGRETGDLPDPIHDFGSDGAQRVLDIDAVHDGNLRDLLVTTARPDGTRQVWRVQLDDDLRLVHLEELPVPADVIAVAPLPR